MENDNNNLTPWFIGSYSNHDDLFESLLLELVHDHINWRRHYHADNAHEQTEGSFDTTNSWAVREIRQQISHLLSELKQSATINSPRHLGYISSDLLLPGVIAQLLTTLYNSNNIMGDVDPATIAMELEAGRELARMLGYNIDPQLKPCAWGHITSGSNTANYDCLWNARAVSCYPLALKETASKQNLSLRFQKHSNKLITECNSWECQNLTVDQILTLQQFIYQQLRDKYDVETALQFFKQVECNRIEHIGMASFFARHWDAKQPMIMVPSTTFSDWQKAMKLLGFGSNQLIKLEVNNRMHVDLDSLKRVLTNAEHNKIPILAVVGILGTMEFGSIDPLDGIVDLRNHFRNKGLNFYFHIDASWGGYLCSIFRKKDGGIVPFKTLKQQFKSFPSHNTYDALSSVKEADSVTVDPHQMGYLPFGTGAFICRNRDISNITRNNLLCFTDRPKNETDKLRQLGEYLIEGTKPGATAIACCLTQRILPLNNEHFGKILSKSIHACEYFHHRIKATMERLSHEVKIVLPMEPDSNILCLAINPANNQNLARMNRFSKRVFEQLHTSKDPYEENEAFFCSSIALLHSDLHNEDAHQLLKKLNISDSSFVEKVENPNLQSNAITVLRHTLLNPWLLVEVNGSNYIDRYCHYLEKILLQVVEKESSSRVVSVSSG